MSKPKSEYSINSPQTYINKRNVDHFLDVLNLNPSRVSTDLGWAKDTLRKYLTYRSLISKEKRKQLADYFHCSESIIINYFPTEDIKEKHKVLNINHNSNKQSISINNKVETHNDYSSELILEKIKSQEKTIELLRKEIKDFKQFMKKEFQKSSDNSNKQQLYILNELRKK